LPRVHAPTTDASTSMAATARRMDRAWYERPPSGVSQQSCVPRREPARKPDRVRPAWRHVRHPPWTDGHLAIPGTDRARPPGPSTTSNGCSILFPQAVPGASTTACTKLSTASAHGMPTPQHLVFGPRSGPQDIVSEPLTTLRPPATIGGLDDRHLSS
jgi:hypothetical protein